MLPNCRCRLPRMYSPPLSYRISPFTGHLCRMGWRSRDGCVSPPKGHFRKRLRRDGLNALLPRRLERNLRKRRLLHAARVRKRKQHDMAKRKRALRESRKTKAVLDE